MNSFDKILDILFGSILIICLVFGLILVLVGGSLMILTLLGEFKRIVGL